ncbi:tetratricopeptide repeat protein [Acidocella aminolytica]|uniref:Tetratricopeptide repeat protein n=2 Tax=Acidocella TaxID=50709 RepID=A0A0D6PCY1_9PROT|nr:tetratricopeptide repeat protein [Acidocella aminolytica]GAN79196.1 hypothetical protein Aam_018_020 [Acidocella aminolytica 101 = DSM 11237]SHE91671.1 hypothetical protein SAMN02746095_01554 [Acidocella aminolytica 101 = DSM 11237]
MTKNIFRSLALAGALALAPALPAFAQSQGASPRQIQTMIDTGQSAQALQALKGVLDQHPQSGVAWYLAAEAQDARGNENAAAQALAKADQYAPGLPFADPQKAAALRTHIDRGLKAGGGVSHALGGVSPVLLVIGGLLLLFVLLRLVSGFRRGGMNLGYRRYPGNPNAPYGPNGPNGPYGPGGGYGPMGGGLGSSIVTGLAAGAGFAAGERIVDGLMGGNEAQAAQPQQDFMPNQDDGLMGDPSWDMGGGNDDLNTDSW